MHIHLFALFLQYCIILLSIYSSTTNQHHKSPLPHNAPTHTPRTQYTSIQACKCKIRSALYTTDRGQPDASDIAHSKARQKNPSCDAAPQWLHRIVAYAAAVAVLVGGNIAPVARDREIYHYIFKPTEDDSVSHLCWLIALPSAGLGTRVCLP